MRDMQSIPMNEHAFPANISRKISPYLVTPWFTLALAAMMVIIYLLDLRYPTGSTGVASLFYTPHSFVLGKAVFRHSNGLCSYPALSCGGICFFTPGNTDISRPSHPSHFFRVLYQHINPALESTSPSIQDKKFSKNLKLFIIAIVVYPKSQSVNIPLPWISR